jgi:DNA repair protein RAD5
VELQAQDRIHRMGQTASSVEVIRFIIKESIEGRMLRVQEKKMAVAGSLGIGQGHNEDGEEERKKRRIEDLQELLG